MVWSEYESPFGRLTLVAGDRGLRALHFPGRAPALDPAARDPGRLADVRGQLDECFAGTARPSTCRWSSAGLGYRGGLERKRALLDFEAAGDERPRFWTHQGQLALL
jgi:O6-methylguanine-DNA--protein-cysteine methyltransferase